VAAGDSGAMILFATGCSELAGTPDPGLAPWVAASRARLDAELGRLRGIPDPDRWDVAVRTADATPDAFGQAYVRYRLAEAMLAEGRGRTPAASALQDCVAIARRLGAAALLEEAQRLAIRARIQLDLAATVTQAPGSPTPRDAARGLGLSDREVDVLELLALGLTDRDIGSRLFITEKTAGHHVSHILTKLTVTRRGEAAAVAHRLGVVGAAGSGPGG
jgi:DNA-binding CsgD family transcriptional regulator